MAAPLSIIQKHPVMISVVIILGALAIAGLMFLVDGPEQGLSTHDLLDIESPEKQKQAFDDRWGTEPGEKYNITFRVSVDEDTNFVEGIEVGIHDDGVFSTSTMSMTRSTVLNYDELHNSIVDITVERSDKPLEEEMNLPSIAVATGGDGVIADNTFAEGMAFRVKFEVLSVEKMNP